MAATTPEGSKRRSTTARWSRRSGPERYLVVLPGGIRRRARELAMLSSAMPPVHLGDTARTAGLRDHGLDQQVAAASGHRPTVHGGDAVLWCKVGHVHGRSLARREDGRLRLGGTPTHGGHDLLGAGRHRELASFASNPLTVDERRRAATVLMSISRLLRDDVHHRRHRHARRPLSYMRWCAHLGIGSGGGGRRSAAPRCRLHLGSRTCIPRQMWTAAEPEVRLHRAPGSNSSGWSTARDLGSPRQSSVDDRACGTSNPPAWCRGAKRAKTGRWRPAQRLLDRGPEHGGSSLRREASRMTQERIEVMPICFQVVPDRRPGEGRRSREFRRRRDVDVPARPAPRSDEHADQSSRLLGGALQ